MVAVVVVVVALIWKVHRRICRRGRFRWRTAASVLLVKLFDNLFEPSDVCLTELEQVFKIQDQDCQLSAPIIPDKKKVYALVRISSKHGSISWHIMAGSTHHCFSSAGVKLARH